MALDAIIFDLDGTLIDTNALHARAWKTAMERFGYSIGEDRILLEIGKSGAKLVPSLLGRAVDQKEGDALRDAKDDVYLDLVEKSGVRTLPGAEGVLRLAREMGLKTALSTGSAEESVEKAAGAAGLDLSLIDVMVTDEDVEVGKPHADAVGAAVEKLSLSPAQCVKVGDTPFDVASARKAGVLCLAVESGAYGREALMRAGARAVYSNVGDLADQLDHAVHLSSPGEIHLTWGAMQGFMRVALEEARIALSSGDLPVGAVLAGGDGQIIAQAHSQTESHGNFLSHGEMQVFQKAVGQFALKRRDLILITTLEPCMMCFGAAMGARVDTIIFALHAPSNGGITRCEPMQSPGMFMPRTVGEVYAEESLELFREWNRKHPGAPYVEDLLGRFSAGALVG